LCSLNDWALDESITVPNMAVSADLDCQPGSTCLGLHDIFTRVPPYLDLVARCVSDVYCIAGFGPAANFVARLSNRLGINQPALYALSTDGINAFALGDARTSGVVFYHGHMLAHLTQDEVESVLAHELAHLASGHAMLMTFLQGMIAPLIAPLAMCAGLFLSLLFGIRGLRQHFIQVYHLLSILLFPVTTFLIALVMRQWEYAADAQAAQLVGKAKYIAALQCLHGSFFQHPDLLSLSAGKSPADTDQWALSHPSLKQRIHALREVG